MVLTPNPSLGAVSFREYDTIFVHGLNAVPATPDPDIDTIDLYGEGLDLILVGKNSSRYPDAVIYCPLPSYEKKTGWRQPMARYIAVQYASGLDASFSPEVYKVEVFNGCSPWSLYVFSNDGAVRSRSDWRLVCLQQGNEYRLSVRNGPFNRGFLSRGMVLI